MKKLFILLVISIFFIFAGCSNQSSRIDQLEKKSDQLEKKVADLEDEILMGGAGGVAANFYPARGLTGDAAGDLDHIGTTANLDAGFVILLEDGTYGDAFLPFVLDETGGDTEAVPSIIDAKDGGNEDWRLCKVYGSEIIGKTSWGANITGNITLGDSIIEVWNKAYQVTAACTVTLAKADSVGYGAAVILWIRDAAEKCIVEIDDADKINLHGTPLAAGNVIDSPLNAGDFIVLISTTDADGAGVDGWITFGYGEADWTDGGAS